MLAAPMPINSWFGSIFCPLFAASDFVIEAASSMPRMPMAMAVLTNDGMRCHSFGPMCSPMNDGSMACSAPSSLIIAKGTSVAPANIA